MEGKKVSLGLVLVLAVALALPLVIGLEAKPDVYVDPTNIQPNGITYIHVRALDPEPDDPSVPDDFLYMEVHQLVVRYPAEGSTEEYMLGTASAPGITGQKIRVDYGEDIAIPYGYGLGAITIKGNDYYWWRTRKGGNPVSPNERIDNVLTPSPTGWTGKYVADVEGRAYYGSGEQEIRLRKYFDIPSWFWVTVPEFGLTAAAVSLIAYWAISARKRKS